MKRAFLSLLCCLAACCHLWAQGTPYVFNFSSADYKAHNRNFDILTDDNGHVFVANFEGLLYYDKADWRVIHTPSTTRITSLFRDSKGNIWAGGFHFFGRLVVGERGIIGLSSLAKRGELTGEIDLIWEHDGKIFFLEGEQKVYQAEEQGIKIATDYGTIPDRSLTTIDGLPYKVVQAEQLDNGLTALVTDGNGIVVIDRYRNYLCTIAEQNGLCSNAITRIVYDGHGLLWGATANGIFAIALPSPFTHFTASEGLRGEVFCIQRFGGQLYAGTINGLFRLQGTRFTPIPEINHACWKMDVMAGRLMVATSQGVYLIAADGSITPFNTYNTMSLLTNEDSFYSGELDGVYLNGIDGMRKKLCNLESVVKIVKDGDESVWIQSLDGQVWMRKFTQIEFKPYKKNVQKNEAATIVTIDGGKVVVVDALDSEPFPYPQFSYTDSKDITWLTDNAGRGLYAWGFGKRQTEFDLLLHPLGQQTTRAMLRDDNLLWIGSEHDLAVIDCNISDPFLKNKPRLRFTSVVIQPDSLLWGGFGPQPEQLPTLQSHERHITISYAFDHEVPVGQHFFRYRLNGGRWSAWDDDDHAEFQNIYYGNYLFEVQARDALGRESEVIGINFSILYPFYMRSYMVVLYLLVAAVIIYLLVQLRLRQLQRDKLRLEAIVQERTSEVVKQRDEIVLQRDEIVKQKDEIVKQKDEIEEKSKSLEKALNDLHQAQHELIRQEKMATVGKLTQGLIDRILNPLNYINNFSKLSQGLVKDIEANIEDEKETMDTENYEDTIDVLDMLRGNLEKVSEHGQNTTRTLKAMEEMLKDRSGGIVPMDLAAVLRQDADMVRNYYAKEMATHGIKFSFECPEGTISIMGNAEQLSKTFMSLLANAFYAVEKKAQKEKFLPEVSMKAVLQPKAVFITIADNGIGIESTIIDKVFDPFFTTKTTGEAAGVGLYLSREIVQNHGGDIAVQSVKNKSTEFTINIPTIEKG